MKSRDRILLIALLAVGLLAGFWFVVLGPKHKESKKLSAEVTAAQARLAQAQAQARTAGQAKAGYQRDYAAVLELGQAVPADDRVPSLLYQLESASRNAHIRFDSIQNNAATSAATAQTGSASKAPTGSAASGSTAQGATPAGTTVGTAGFPTMPFAFSFDGSYQDLRHLVDAVNRFVEVRGSRIVVRGRLLQIDGITLTPRTDSKSSRVAATINATAYVLPAEQGATNGATGSAPAGSTPATGTGTGTTSAAVTSTSTATTTTGGTR